MEKSQKGKTQTVTDKKAAPVAQTAKSTKVEKTAKPAKAAKADKVEAVAAAPVVDKKAASAKAPKAPKAAKAAKVAAPKAAKQAKPKAAKAEAPVAEAVAEVANAEETVGRKTRSFKAIYVNTSGEVVMEGRYCGAKPKQAACKALTGIYKTFNREKKSIKKDIYFGVKETTRKGKGKYYWYNGERVKLETPVVLELKNADSATPGKQITYKFNNLVKKASEQSCAHLMNYKVVDEPVVEAAEAQEVAAEQAPKKRSKSTKTEKSVVAPVVAAPAAVEEAPKKKAKASKKTETPVATPAPVVAQAETPKAKAPKKSQK